MYHKATHVIVPYQYKAELFVKKEVEGRAKKLPDACLPTCTTNNINAIRARN